MNPESTAQKGRPWLQRRFAHAVWLPGVIPGCVHIRMRPYMEEILE